MQKAQFFCIDRYFFLMRFISDFAIYKRSKSNTDPEINLCR